jgi:hypothetical protein
MRLYIHPFVAHSNFNRAREAGTASGERSLLVLPTDYGFICGRRVERATRETAASIVDIQPLRPRKRSAALSAVRLFPSRNA